MFFLLLSSVIAIGMSPPDVYADYEEGATYEFDIKIINNAHSESHIQMSARGEYAEFVEFSEKDFAFKRDELFHTVTITVTLPNYNELTSFGKQKIHIRASEGSSSKSTGVFSVSTAITGWFEIDIPIPGKYAVIDSFQVSHALEGQDVPFSLTVRNRGTQQLSGGTTNIYIRNYQGDVVGKQSYYNINIPIEETYVLNDVLSTSEYSSSKYVVLAEFVFDPEKVPSSKETSFFVGSTDVTLLSYTKNVSANKINKARFELQSLWGSPLKNIRGSIDVEGISHPLPVLDFEPFENKQLDSFLDIKETNQTTISGVLLLEIPVDETTTVEKEFPLVFHILQETAPHNESPFKESSFMFVGIILIVLLLIGVNIVIFMKRKK